MGAFPFWAPCRGIRTRKGAELRKREAFSSAAREERGAGGARRTRTPLIAHHLIEKAPSDGAFLFCAQRMGFEPASTSATKAVAKKWQK